MAKRILLVVASRGFQPVEYFSSKKVLKEAGFEVVTASDEDGAAIASDGGGEANVDVILNEVNAAEYDGVFIVGGPGALERLDNEKVYRLAREAAENHKPFGAICISPRILARAGVLKGRKATGWDGDGELAMVLSSAGAKYARESVVADGNLVTANGPMSAEEWGKEIVRLMKGK